MHSIYRNLAYIMSIVSLHNANGLHCAANNTQCGASTFSSFILTQLGLKWTNAMNHCIGWCTILGKLEPAPDVWYTISEARPSAREHYGMASWSLQPVILYILVHTVPCFLDLAHMHVHAYTCTHTNTHMRTQEYYGIARWSPDGRLQPVILYIFVHTVPCFLHLAHMDVHAYTRIHAHTCTHTCTCTHTHTHAHNNNNTHAHTYIYTHLFYANIDTNSVSQMCRRRERGKL